MLQLVWIASGIPRSILPVIFSAWKGPERWDDGCGSVYKRRLEWRHAESWDGNEELRKSE